MLGTEHKAVIVSTLREVRGLLPLVDQGYVNDVRSFTCLSLLVLNRATHDLLPT
jgi:hypothetical protein